MKAKNQPGASVTKPLLKDLMDRQKAEAKIRLQQQASIGNSPLKPAELDQDAGGGYNADFVDPQT